MGFRRWVRQRTMTCGWERGERGGSVTKRLSRLAAWLTVPIVATGLAVALAVRARIPETAGLGAEGVVIVLGFLAFAVVGSIILARRPGHPVGWALAIVALSTGIFGGLEAWAAYQMSSSGSIGTLGLIGLWGNSWYWYAILWLLFAYLPAVFPDGRLLSPRLRPVAWVYAVAGGLGVVLGALVETMPGQTFEYAVANPIGVSGMPHFEALPIFPVYSVLLPVGAIGGFACLAVRLRRARGDERLQLKWLLLPVAAMPLLVVTENILPASVQTILFGLVMVGLPAAIGVAVLRYRLYEIDRIVSRTLSYALVTAALVGMYAGGVVLLTPLVAGVGGGSELAVAASTLAVAAAFGPVRRRVQSAVDRRFNRTRYDAQLVVEQFAGVLREQVALQRLTEDLVSAVNRSVEPAAVTLWLREAA
jgi:hypothetical protein